MLALTRREQERVRFKIPGIGIGWLVIGRIEHDKVRVYLEFPSDVIIKREELLDEADRFIKRVQTESNDEEVK